MTKDEYILNSILKECYRHRKRLQYAYNRLKPIFPLTINKLSNLTEEQVSILDQSIYRFTKLQDLENYLFDITNYLRNRGLLNEFNDS
ncbi:MAG: hypothetical protein WHS65_08025 [Melioribacteraceae bacterium]